MILRTAGSLESAVISLASSAEQLMRSLSDDEIRQLFSNGVVRHGPFAGLRYAELTSVGSALYPKLLGSYESELHPWMHEVCEAGYSEIIDVGCAEGYYAVGLALRVPDAMVYAYDLWDGAQRLCAAFAELNQVADRMSVRSLFTADELRDIRIRRRGLIICDCEGGENDIFTEQTRNCFVDWDLLIETHDFMDITISTRMADLFRDTHERRSILSVDDIQKAKTYNYPELEGLDLATRRAILAEFRPTLMEWQFLTSRSHSIS